MFNIEKELKNENLYFYLIVYKEEFCGFIEIVDLNNRLIISEIQINDKMKGTRLILHIIKFIYNNLGFLNYYKVYFNINKNNIISNKTFKHLGAEITLEKEKTIQYEIKRIDVEKYLKSLIKN